FPFLKLNDNECVLLDDNGGGHINPRKFVSAQKKVAQMQGCHIIDSVVCNAELLQEGFHVVRTESNEIIKAKRLLIATVMLRIPEDEALRLSSMPAVIKRIDETAFGAYILPPVKYPDGKRIF
ncbi:DAO domain-containing protein, partial [Trichonephila inaurata madagascariensis]